MSACLTGAHAACADVSYAYDDGISSITLGPPSTFAEFGDIDVLWGNYFFAEPSGAFVTRIDFGLGSLSSGGQDAVKLWIFVDQDNDADPTNAVPIYSTEVIAEDLGFGFSSVEVPGVQVDGGFFVAVGHVAELDSPGALNRYPSPARYDPDGRADRSWFFYDSDIPEDDLASSGFVQRMDGPFVTIQGAFAIRVTGAAIDPCPADLNKDGASDISDLLRMLSVFNSQSAVGDVNKDGSTDISDLLALLAVFDTQCP